MAHQPKVHFVPFSCASSSGNEVEILGFLKTHRSVIIGRFKPRKSRKGRREDKKRGREGKGQKSTSKTMNRVEPQMRAEPSQTKLADPRLRRSAARGKRACGLRQAHVHACGQRTVGA